MPFREKIAWIAVVTTAVVWGTFFVLLLVRVHSGAAPGRPGFGWFTVAVGLQVALTVAASIATAISNPQEAGAVRDERDRAVARRSTAFAYPVLIVGVVFAAASLHVGNGPIGMAYGIMGAIVVAELVHYGAQIVGYRAAWHG